ncbi:DNA-binding protein [Microbacterium sp. CH12i]|uniref:DNA-processing protein DprA n=1 Tax=Microbacterium sp. CH12i TaxID=1479651 RepID=UPI000460C6B9|nr:DNA-processing protein DprA [Microbacterium sp. CH12i]KDA04640.1 DNA-binding protein [Microbacterium sp. CH12i]
MTTTLTTATDLEARAAWSIIAEPSDAIAGAFTQTLGHAAALTAITSGRTTLIRALTELQGIGDRTADEAANRWLPRLTKSYLTDALATAKNNSITLIDPNTIPGLRDLGENAPHAIWARGDLTNLTRPNTDRLALTGARAATSYGENVAHEFASDLAARDIIIVSGAAYGIDGSAHRAALAAGGTTIAWLAGGIDRPYPIGHSNLIDRIAANGVVASELAPGSAPTRWRFLGRNRLIAATSAATVIVEAGWRSGSLNTAGHVTTLGRTLGAVPGPITSAASAGCHRLIREYDAQIVTSATDAYELLGR